MFLALYRQFPLAQRELCRSPPHTIPLRLSLCLSLATQGRSRPFGQGEAVGVFCLLLDCAEAVASSFYRPVRSA